MTSVLRDRLRAETIDSHTRLEVALDLPARLEDRRQALIVLSRLHGLFAGIEPGLERLLGPDAMDGRHRVGDLRRDLDAMGLSSEEIDRLAVLAWSPPTTSDEGMGALYVLEGMRLGGRVIARVVAAQTWAPQDNLRFWSNAPATNILWTRFLRRLDGVASPDLALRGAIEMFRTCLTWLVPHSTSGSLAPGPDERYTADPEVDGRVAQR